MRSLLYFVAVLHDEPMGTVAQGILEVIRYGPLDDDVLARHLGVTQRQTVNQAARKLEAAGRLRRYVGPEGKIINEMVEGSSFSAPMPRGVVAGSVLTEDEVKTAVRDQLVAQGFDVTVAWDRTRGIDIDARHSDGRRLIIEAKGEVRSDQQQGNNFLNALGELLQRMDDPEAAYALALPANRRYRGLVSRLPSLVRARLQLSVFWVSRDRDSFRVEVDGM